MTLEGPLDRFLKAKQLGKREMWTDLTIYSLPRSLIKEFAELVANPSYPQGISSAIQDLMYQAVREKKKSLATNKTPRTVQAHKLSKQNEEVS